MRGVEGDGFQKIFLGVGVPSCFGMSFYVVFDSVYIDPRFENELRTHAPKTTKDFSANRLLVETLSSIDDQMPLVSSSERSLHLLKLERPLGGDKTLAEAILSY